MPLRKSKGNMYPWVTHTHSHLAGECSHKCSYCYVKSLAARLNRFAPKNNRYKGPLRLIEKEFLVNYGKGKRIFIEHCNDLFAESVPGPWIERILYHCRYWQNNEYVFQTKNPKRLFVHVVGNASVQLLRTSLIGVTIETNRDIPTDVSSAPQPSERKKTMGWFSKNVRKFVTVEPIMDFDLDVLLYWLVELCPEFVNIGADSKGHGLPEPSGEKVLALICGLRSAGIEVREKRNLGRLLNKENAG